VHLSGHVHEAESEQARSGAGGDFVRVVAGAAHGEREPAGTPARHGYNVAAVVQVGGRLALRVWPRRWSERRKGFIVDGENVAEGHPWAEHGLRLRWSSRRRGKRPPEATRRPILARPELEARLGRVLRDQRQLMLLAPRRGGARTLVRALAEAAGFGVGQRTVLVPPRVRCDAPEFFRTITDDNEVRGATDYIHWQRRRADGRPHLVVVLHAGAPGDLVDELGNALRTLTHEGGGEQYSILIAGGARAAELRVAATRDELSIFSGIPCHFVPDFTVDEVDALLGLRGRAGELGAEALHRLTGGYAGFLDEALSDSTPLDTAGTTELLRRSGQVEGILRKRLNTDDQQHRPDGRHAASVLRPLVAAGSGETSRTFDRVQCNLDYGEARLYYDGLLRVTPDRRLALRCDAVRLVAAVALVERA
jgi:hypothetical protein